MSVGGLNCTPLICRRIHIHLGSSLFGHVPSGCSRRHDTRGKLWRRKEDAGCRAPWRPGKYCFRMVRSPPPTCSQAKFVPARSRSMGRVETLGLQGGLQKIFLRTTDDKPPMRLSTSQRGCATDATRADEAGNGHVEMIIIAFPYHRKLA